MTTTASDTTLPVSLSDLGSEELRAVLSAVPSNLGSYGSWWSTAAGVDLYESIDSRISTRLAKYFAKKYGARCDSTEITNTAVELLAQNFTIKSVSRADNCWGYLYRTLHNEVIRQLGYVNDLDAEMDELVALHSDSEDDRYTPVTRAVQLTAQTLVEYTPETVAHALEDAIYYFAERAHSRISHLYTEATRDPELLATGLNREQILAIANVALGSRRGNGEASLLAGFLQNESWVPSEHPVTRKALQTYEIRMLRTSTASILSAVAV